MGEGAEGVHIREVIQALRELGHDVLVVSIVGEPSESPNASVKRWRGVRKLIPATFYELAEIGYNIADLVRIERAFREFRPHAIYDRYNSYSTAALRVARR